MFNIPLLSVNLKAFPDHGWRFGNARAFYISIDDSNAVDETSSETDSSDDDQARRLAELNSMSFNDKTNEMARLFKQLDDLIDK